MKYERRQNDRWGQWLRTVDRAMLFAVMFIVAVGLTLLMAASPAVAERLGHQSFHFVYRQLFFLSIGVVLMLFISMMNIVTLRRVAALGFLGALLALLAVQMFGVSIKGAQRWISVAGFGLQPSEFMKPFFAVMVGWMLARRQIDEGFPGFVIAVILWVLVVVLLMLQPDFGMTIAMSMIWGVQMFVAGLPWLWVFGCIGLAAAGVVVAYNFWPHVANRINMFFDPTTGDNYQTAKSLEAIRNGGLFGTGPGEGVVKEILPDSHTDFIFAVAGEEFGTIVCMLLLCAFSFIVLRGFVRISQDEDLFVIYAGTGLLVLFGMQTLVNMGVALSLLPNTGMTLPFISYGGSSVLAISITMGMILAFTRKRYGLKSY